MQAATKASSLHGMARSIQVTSMNTRLRVHTHSPTSRLTHTSLRGIPVYEVVYQFTRYTSLRGQDEVSLTSRLIARILVYQCISR